MKKIIAAFDGLKYTESTKTYALQLAKQTGAYVIGVFLDDASYTSYNPVNLIYERAGLVGSAKRKWDKKDAKARAAATRNFELACKNAGIAYGIRHDQRKALKELLLESIYADLLIIGRDETLSRSVARTPTPFIKQLLLHTKCPVLVVPPEYKLTGKVVMLYDGEAGSVNAIKMFSYMLQEFQISGLEIVFAKKDQHVADPCFALLEEWIKNHFPHTVEHTILHGDPKEQIVAHLKGRQDHPIVVLGSNHYGKLYTLLHEGLSDTLMKKLSLPLFIVPTN